MVISYPVPKFVPTTGALFFWLTLSSFSWGMHTSSWLKIRFNINYFTQSSYQLILFTLALNLCFRLLRTIPVTFQLMLYLSVIFRSYFLIISLILQNSMMLIRFLIFSDKWVLLLQQYSSLFCRLLLHHLFMRSQINVFISFNLNLVFFRNLLFYPSFELPLYKLGLIRVALTWSPIVFLVHK